MKFSKLFCTLSVGIFCVLALPYVTSAAENETEALPIKITGDSVEYFYKENRAVGQGNIRIEYEGSTLTADKVEVNLLTKEAQADGHVRLLQDGAVYEGDSLFVNLDSKSANIHHLQAKIAPYYYVKGEEVHKVEEQYYSIENGYITTCEGPMCADEDYTPPYRIQAREVLYYPEDRIEIHHAVFYIMKVPVFYIPIMVIPVVDIDRFPLEIQAGRKKEWGAYALTRYRYYISPEQRGNVLMDVREKQGLAGGIEHFYDTQSVGDGAVRYYYADDRCGETDTDCSQSQEHLSPESSRYRAQLRHRWKVNDETGLNVELNKISDEFFIQDFFTRDEFERIAAPENYVSLIHTKDEYTLSALSRFRVNDFVDVVERTPEVRLDTHTKAIGESDFYIRHELQGSRLNHAFKDEDIKDHNEEATRVDARHTLSYVYRLKPWTLTPFIAARETFYSRDAVGDDRDFVRVNLESGFDLSTKYFKTYNIAFNKFGMEINQLRHIVTPNIRYRYQSRPTHTRSSLYEFDSIDKLDHESFFRFELENKFQTRTANNGTRTLLRSILFTDLEIPRMNNTRLDTAGLDVEFSPNDKVSFDFETFYSFERDQFDSANVDMVFNFDPFWIGVGQRYQNGSSNQTTAQVDWKINDDLRARFYERFDFSGNETDEFEASLEVRNVLCWTTNLTYNYRNGGSFYVSFSPSAFAENSFQTNQYYRPIDGDIQSPVIALPQ